MDMCSIDTQHPEEACLQVHREDTFRCAVCDIQVHPHTHCYPGSTIGKCTLRAGRLEFKEGSATSWLCGLDPVKPGCPHLSTRGDSHSSPVRCWCGDTE
jgi:hypothetical protein